jgi:hypothetical protein
MLAYVHHPLGHPFPGPRNLDVNAARPHGSRVLDA